MAGVTRATSATKHPLSIVRTALVAAAMAAMLTAGFVLPADARGGGRGFSGHGRHGPQFAGGRRHGNDAYVKSASDERDMLLTSRIKSICRGC
jgi:hypothetical protein